MGRGVPCSDIGLKLFWAVGSWASIFLILGVCDVQIRAVYTTLYAAEQVCLQGELEFVGW